MTSSVPSVERALAILELLAGSRSGLTLPEVSRRLHLPKSSTYCVLLTLERCGYLYQNQPNNRYRFAQKLFALSHTALDGIELRERAAPHLRRLVEKTRLTAHLGTFVNRGIVLIDKVEPAGVPRLATWIGKGMDLHSSALGKAVMATWSEDQFLRLVREYSFPRYNENTITTESRLRKDLEQVRRLGYALDDEEGEIGFRCIGAAILDGEGKAVAAASVSGSTTEISDEDYDRLGALVQDTSARISAELRSDWKTFAEQCRAAKESRPRRHPIPRTETQGGVAQTLT